MMSQALRRRWLLATAMIWLGTLSTSNVASEPRGKQPDADVWIRWSPSDDSETTWVKFKSTQKDWERELYEARNWMPSAKDDIDPRLEKRKSPKSRKRLVRYKRRKRRVNVAQYKAAIAASIGIRRLVKPGRPATSIAPFGLRHVGGNLGLGGGNVEGAGFSKRSPSEALAACSYSGFGYPVLYQGVARGRDGFFAYKIYRR